MARKKTPDYLMEAWMRDMGGDIAPVKMTPVLRVLAVRPFVPPPREVEPYPPKPVNAEPVRLAHLSEQEQEWACKYNHYQSVVSCPALAAALLVISELLNGESQPQLLTPAEAAARLRSSPETVIALIRKGYLEAANMSDSARPRYLIQHEAIRDLIESRSVQPNMPIHTRPKAATRAYNRFSGE